MPSSHSQLNCGGGGYGGTSVLDLADFTKCHNKFTVVFLKIGSKQQTFIYVYKYMELFCFHSECMRLF